MFTQVLDNFATDSDQLTRQHKDWLSTVVCPYLVKNPKAMAYIAGFASRNYTAGHNMDLSHRRASNVARYIVSHPSVDKSRIGAVTAHGETQSGGGPDDNSPEWRSVSVSVFSAPSISTAGWIPVFRTFVSRTNQCFLMGRPVATRALSGEPGERAFQAMTEFRDQVGDGGDPSTRYGETKTMVLSNCKLAKIETYTCEKHMGFATGKSHGMKFTWSERRGSDVVFDGHTITADEALAILNNPLPILVAMENRAKKGTQGYRDLFEIVLPAARKELDREVNNVKKAFHTGQTTR